MKHLFIQLNIAIFLLTVFSFQCLGADKYDLKLNLEKGKTYKQRTVTDMNMTTDMMGQEMKVNMKSEMLVNYDVTGLNNGIFDIRIAYQKIKMDMTSSMGSFSVDSDSPNAMGGDLLKSFAEVPIDVQMNQQGKVTSVKGADKLVEKIGASNNEMLKQMLSQQFSEKTIQLMFEQTSNFFPEKPVEIGDSWDVASNINTGTADIINKMKITLKQVNNTIATFEFKGTLTTPEGGAVVKVQGMDAKVSVNGEQAGTVQFDLKTGWIVRSEANQKFTQNIELMGQTMPQKIESKVVVTAE